MKILYICTHNRCRSILSEAITNHLGQGRLVAKSAGSQPVGEVHPLSIRYLKEAGIPVEGLQSQSWDDFEDFAPDIVVTVCDSAAGETCPVYFGNSLKVHWGLEDPSKLQGSEAEVANAFRATIAEIGRRVEQLLALGVDTQDKAALKQALAELGADLADRLPNIVAEQWTEPSVEQFSKHYSDHKPRILLLYGSLRTRSYSRLVVEECARLLETMGAEARIFNPEGLPQPDVSDDSHPKVKELRELMMWSEGQVWCSPERHGAMTGILKSQIDWIPLNMGGIRPTQGKTLAVMQVCGGSQSFNAVNQMRVLGRWMRMFTIPNQSSVAKEDANKSLI